MTRHPHPPHETDAHQVPWAWKCLTRTRIADSVILLSRLKPVTVWSETFFTFIEQKPRRLSFSKEKERLRGFFVLLPVQFRQMWMHFLTWPSRNQKSNKSITKVRRHERTKCFYFVLSIFRVFVIIFLKFSARENTNFRTKELKW